MTKSVMIDGVEYQAVQSEGLQRMIVIVDNRGLTFVGDVDVGDLSANDDAEILISNARCVIRWGTTEHLAELAADGPRSNTKLGRARDFYANKKNIIGRYVCSEAWNE